jgi:N-acetylmuramoyl-L-alanine amidase
MNPLEALLYLTLNVYHEARSEPDLGQQAVVHVTLNRSQIRKMPVKDIVLQPHQFSWTSKPKKEWIPENWNAFYKAYENVAIALQSEDFTNGATHYHHKKINPYWANEFQVIATWGAHKFYKGE